MNDIPSAEQLLSLRNYFDSGVTRPYAFRRQQLQKLKAAILQYEEALYAALHADLKKSPEESWVTETGFLIGSINRTLKGLREWMQPERVPTNLVNFSLIKLYFARSARRGAHYRAVELSHSIVVYPAYRSHCRGQLHGAESK